MKRAILLSVVMLLIIPSIAIGQVAESLREQNRVREGLLTKQIQEMSDIREDLREIWLRLEQLTGALLQAEGEGETVASLRLRDADLRKTEAELLAALFEAQQKRNSMLENRTMIAEIDLEVQRLAAAEGGAAEPLTGSWRFLVEPGQEGVAHLNQRGTLVEGTYSLSGGFSGSFRGTFVAGKVRLERIDSQYGFAAIYYGRLVGRGRNARLQGNWEAPQLASGLPSAGGWTATRVVDEE